MLQTRCLVVANRVIQYGSINSNSFTHINQLENYQLGILSLRITFKLF